MRSLMESGREGVEGLEEAVIRRRRGGAEGADEEGVR